MRILCGYIPESLEPETFESIRATGYTVDLVDVSGSLTAYWHAIRDRWTGDEDLVTVEQDNVIDSDVLPSFDACPEDWCCYKYLGGEEIEVSNLDGTSERTGYMKYSLGCTKFSAKFQQKFPAENISGDYLAWFMIDFRFKTLFHDLWKLEPHVHGEIEHLHRYGIIER